MERMRDCDSRGMGSSSHLSPQIFIMTIKEFIQELSKYPEDATVKVRGHSWYGNEVESYYNTPDIEQDEGDGTILIYA